MIVDPNLSKTFIENIKNIGGILRVMIIIFILHEIIDILAQVQYISNYMFSVFACIIIIEYVVVLE